MQGDMRHGFHFQRSLIIPVCDVKNNGKLLIIKFTFLVITMYFNHQTPYTKSLILEILLTNKNK